MPRIGYAPTAKTRCLSSGACVDMESGGRETHRFSTTGKLRREVVNQGAGLGLEDLAAGGLHPVSGVDYTGAAETQDEVVEVEDEEMGVTPQTTNDVVEPTLPETVAMEVDEPEPVPAYTPPTSKAPGIPAKAYPGQTAWRPLQQGSSVMSTTSRPISYSPGDFMAEPAPEPGHNGSMGSGATASSHLSPDPVPKKARGPMGETRPLAIVLPNGEALWFTTRDINVDTPRLVILWSLFQYLAMSKRPLSGFQWGKVGVVYIRRVAQDIIHGAQQRGAIMDRIREANRSNPLLMDLESAYPEPQDAAPPTSASTGAYRPNFNFRDVLQRPSLGEHFCPGEGPPRAGRGALPCIYDQPTHEMPLAASIGEADYASNCMGMWARMLLGQENPKGVPAKLSPGLPLRHPLQNLRLQQPNRLPKRSTKTRTRTWSSQLRRGPRSPELRRNVPHWNGG